MLMPLLPATGWRQRRLLSCYSLVRSKVQVGMVAHGCQGSKHGYRGRHSAGVVVVFDGGVHAPLDVSGKVAMAAKPMAVAVRMRPGWHPEWWSWQRWL